MTGEERSQLDVKKQTAVINIDIKHMSMGSFPHSVLCHMNTNSDAISSAEQYEAIKQGTGRPVWTNESEWLLWRKRSI